MKKSTTKTRILAILLVLMMCFFLAACGSSEPVESTSEPETTSSSVETTPESAKKTEGTLLQTPLWNLH